MTDTATQFLPPSAYFNADWYEREQLQLFSRTWRYAGTTDDLKAPGSYRSLQVGRHPLAVVRGKDGELRAFYNVWRHRGTAVLSGSGVADKRIVCPYHNWTYGLDGCLLAVTQRNAVDPHLDRAKLGLHADGVRGETARASIVPSGGATTTPEELIEYCRGGLASPFPPVRHGAHGQDHAPEADQAGSRKVRHSGHSPTKAHTH